MPYFASLGYPCVALSLQGTGGTPAVPEGAKKVKISNHVDDWNAFLEGLGDNSDGALGLGLGINPQIALIGHSFGGFFGGNDDDNGISDQDLERYQSYFERDTVATIDLADLATKLPSLLVDKQSGNAPFAKQLQTLPLKPLVVGTLDDFIVDRKGVDETSRYMGIKGGGLMVDSPHDVMLGNKWRNGADAILNWVKG